MYRHTGTTESFLVYLGKKGLWGLCLWLFMNTLNAEKMKDENIYTLRRKKCFTLGLLIVAHITNVYIFSNLITAINTFSSRTES